MTDPERARRDDGGLSRALCGVGQVDSERVAAALARTEAKLLGASTTTPPDYGRYVFLKELGAGGFGRVDLAYDPDLDRKVALKQLLRGASSRALEDGGREALLREAQTLAKLRHPHIVSVYGVQELTSAKGRKSLSIVMEFVEGVTLREWLSAEERPLKTILRVFIEAGRGLQAAHEAGIIHRDFKPDNVIIDAEGRARVLDFGLSEAEGEVSQSASGSRDGSFTGTPAYMAPEHFECLGGDARSDVFSYAVSLWEALAGGRPFPGATISEVRRRVVLGRIEALPPESSMPRRIERILRRALAVEPGSRTPSMAALLAELGHDPWQPLRRAAQLLAALVVLLSAGLGVFLLTRPGVVEVEVEGPRGALRPSGVWVGERALELGPAGARGEVEPGVHRLRVEAAGMLPEESIIDVERGALVRRAIILDPRTGELNVELAPAGATVLVDGVEHGSQILHQAVEVGAHQLRARLLGHYEERRTVTIEAEGSAQAYISLAQAESWSRRQTGVRARPTWIGDLTGDGLPELAHRTYNILTVSDPWRDRDLWELTLGGGLEVRDLWVDTDGDGRRELVTLERLEGRLVASLWRHARPGEEGPRRRWRVEADISGVDEALRWPSRPPLALAVRGEHPDTLVLADFPPGTTRALGLVEGRELWRRGGERILSEGVGRGATGLSILQREGQQLRAIDAASGALRWSVRPGESRAMIIDTAELNGDHVEDLLVGVGLGAEEGEGALLAYDGGDGRLLWRRRAREVAILAGEARRGEVGTVAILGGGGGAQENVAVLHGDGTTRWSAPAPPEATIRWWPAEGGKPAQVELLHPSGVELRSLSDGALVDQLATAAAPVTEPVHVDWDSDGHLDLIVGCEDRTLVGLRPGVGWTGAVSFDSVPESVEASGDVDRDGYPDLLVASFGPRVISGRKSLWRRSASDAIRATPRVLDVDGDGELELVAFGAFSRRTSLHIFDAATGVLKHAGEANTTNTLRPPSLLPREDGGVDLLVTTPRRLIRFSGKDASTLAEVDVSPSYASPALLDLDGDARPEVVITPWSTEDPIEVRSSTDLRLLWSLDLAGSGDGTWCEAVAYRVAGAPRPLIALGLHEGDMVVLDSRSGEERWRVALGARQVYPPTIVAPRGEDGGAPWLLASAAGRRGGGLDLVALSGDDGEEMRRWPGLGSGLGGALVTTGNENPEIGERLLIVATEDRGLVAVTVEGSERWRYQIRAAGAQPRASAPLSLASFGDDGRLTVLAAMRDGTLYAIDATTGELQWRYTSEDPNIEATPFAADVDRDGHPEVIVAGHDRQLAVLRAPRRRSAARRR